MYPEESVSDYIELYEPETLAVEFDKNITE